MRRQHAQDATATATNTAERRRHARPVMQKRILTSEDWAKTAKDVILFMTGKSRYRLTMEKPALR
jgi:hypothetical protein